MPLYEYVCPQCHQRFEKLRPMAQADAPIQCPEGHKGAQRVLSVFATIGGTSAGDAVACGPAPAGSRFT